MAEVIVLGDIILDIIVHIPSYPQPGGDGIARAISIKSGGSAANTARALAQCGISTGLIGRAGNDVLAQQALADLRRAGVESALIQRDPTTCGGMMVVIVTPDGQRTMIGYRGANVHTQPGELDAAAIGAADWLHLSGYALLAAPQRKAAQRALSIAHRAGVRISLDPGLEIARQDAALVHSLLPQIDVLFPNLDELYALAAPADNVRDALRSLHRQNVAAIALKLGDRGCVLSTRGVRIDVPAFSTPVIDTTGAGDAFAAGLIAGQMHGLDLRACGLWANALGALTASVEGSHAPDLETLGLFLQKHMQLARWRDDRAALQELDGHIKELAAKRAINDQPRPRQQKT